MKNSLVFSFLFLIYISCNAQTNYNSLVIKADSLYKAKNYQQSNEVYIKALQIEKNDKNDLYNAACAAALAGDNEHAFDFLNLSVDKGWNNLQHIEVDNDLKSLHNLPKWSELIAKLKANVAKIEAGYNKPVKDELEGIYTTDQGNRIKYINAQKQFGFKHPTVDSLVKVMNHDDSLNNLRVIKILDKYGWLGEDEIGNKGNLTLFLVIQHSDLNVQQKYLPMMRLAVKNGKAKASSLALLEDRVALGEGKKQTYGSQIGMNQAKNITYVLPLIDPDHVDERRATVGLGPLADYIKQWGLVWDVEAYKKQLPEIEKLEKKEQ